MIFGALIIFFLIVEPHGLARLWAIGKEKLRSVAVSALEAINHTCDTHDAENKTGVAG